MGLFDFLKGGKPNQSSPSKGDINARVGGMGTALFDACLSGYTNRAKSLIDAGADPNVRSFVNYPEDALFEPGIPQEVGALLFERTAIKHRHPDFYHHMELGITNLYFPTLHGDDEIVHLLLEAGADPDGISFNGIFPLYVAAEIGSLRIVADLVEHGSDINKTTPKGNTALSNAAEEGKLDVVAYLLKHGADPYIRNDSGETAADAALRCGQTDAEMIISDFVGLGRRNNTRIDVRAIFDEMVRNDMREALSRLVIASHASTPEAIDLDDLGETLEARTADAFFGEYGSEISAAIQNSSEIRSTADRNASFLPALMAASMTNKTISTFLVDVTKSYCLVKGIVEGSDYDVYLALEAGADPNRRCLYRGTLHTPIIAAARSGNTSICERLIDAGADVNQAQSNSETALANAAQLDDYDMVMLLLDKGADPNALTYAGTALAITDNLAIVVALAAWGADPNIADADGDLPIIGFIDQRRYAIVQELIDLGSDLDHRNKVGETPVEHAMRCGDSTIIGMMTGASRYEPEFDASIPQQFARSLERRITSLLRLTRPLDAYQDYGDRRDPKNVTQGQIEAFGKALELSSRGLDAKRAGDLVTANELYMDAFDGDIIPRTANIWGWFQVLLVAKNFRDARLVLRFYHAVASSYNCIRRDRGEINQEIESGLIPDCLLTPDFKPREVLEWCMRVWLFDKSAVEEKITTYTGLNPSLKPYYYGDAPVWRRPYRMSSEEYGHFLSCFAFGVVGDDAYKDEPDDTPRSEREVLEAEVRSGNVRAYSSLARLIHEEDEQRAIELCEEAIALGDDDDAPFFLAWLLSDTDPERSKELYQRLVDAGSCYAAANNLGLLVKDEDPEQAAELFQKAIDDGNTNRAAKNLADLVSKEDPDRAIELYEMAIEAGNTDACTRLAFLLRDRDPDKAIELYKQVVESGDVFDSAFQLGMLLADRDTEQSIHYYEMAIEAGNHSWPAYDLAELVRDKDADEAKRLYGLSADAGNNFARAALARMVYEDDRQRAIELCEAAVADGDRGEAAFFLAWLLEGSDLERAKRLYQACVDAGNSWGAGRNLGNLIKDEDPERAAELFEKSLQAGNTDMRVPLARLVYQKDRQRAIELCEAAVADGDRGDGAFFLAWLLEAEDIDRSKELYQLCIDNGYSNGAANNLGVLVKADEPERAKELFELAIKSGNSFYATANLADMLAESDPERAIELYQSSIDAGNVSWCAKLARMLLGTDRERAKKLCELAVDSGDRDDAAFILAWLLEESDLERAKELYQACVDAGYSWGAGRNLGNLVKDEDPERAAELYEKSLSAGNTEVRVPLARLIYQKDRQRAIELCEAAVADGDTNDGMFFLAWLLETEDVERSKELYQACVDAGYSWGAGRNLGNLVKDEDPERAAELYEKSLSAGNTEVRVPLARLIYQKDRQRAIELCEAAVADGDMSDGGFYLAYLLADEDPVRSKELYQILVDNGDYWAAANNLANLIKEDEPERAVELFKKSIEAGNIGLAAMNLANLLQSAFHDAKEAERYFDMAIEKSMDDAVMLGSIGGSLMGINAKKATELFKRAMSLGDLSVSPCNLGHMLFFDDPVEAQSLYETSIRNEVKDESTEAYIGLSLLAEDEDTAEELLSFAKQRSNYAASIDFMANYYQDVNPTHADRLRSL